MKHVNHKHNNKTNKKRKNKTNKNKTRKSHSKKPTINKIIHISGASGSGKTTLGNKLKAYFKQKHRNVAIKDLDDLFHQFMKRKGYKWGFKFDTKEYQNYIDNYIARHKNKPIIFVGLNLDMHHNPNHYYNLHSNYNYYVRLNSDKVFQQKCERLLNDISQKHNIIIKEIKQNETETINGLSNAFKFECGYKQIIKETNDWNKVYKKKGYTFLSSDKIFNKITTIV